MKVVDYYHGKDQFLQEKRNTSFSALGRLSPFRGRLEVTLFENAFAKVKLPYDALPPCLDVRRVNVTYSEQV